MAELPNYNIVEEVRTAESKKASLDARLEVLRKSVAIMQDEEAKYTARKQDLDLLTKQTEQAESRKQAAERDAQEAEARAAESNRIAATINTQAQLLSENEKEINKQQARLSDARQRAEKAQDEMHTAEKARDARVKEIRDELAVEEARLSSMRTQKMQEIERHESIVRGLEADILSLKNQKEVENGKVMTLKKAQEAHAARATEAQDRRADAESELGRLSLEIENKKKESASTNAAREAELDEREKSLQEREGAVSVREDSLDEKQKMLVSAKGELEKIHGKPINIKFPD